MEKPHNFETSPGDERKPHKEQGVTYDRVIHTIEAGMGVSDIRDHDDMIERVQNLKVGEDDKLWDDRGQCLIVKKIAENVFDIELIPEADE